MRAATGPSRRRTSSSARIRDELVKPDDRANYALAQTSLQRIRDEQTRLAGNITRPAPPVEVVRPPVNTTTPPTNPTTTPTNPNTQPGNTGPGNTTTPPTIRPVPPPVTEPLWLAGFRRQMDAARAAMRQSRYTEARGNVTAAANGAQDAARRQEADALRRDIDTAQNIEAQRIVNSARDAIRRKDPDTALTHVAALETLAPGHASLGSLRAGIDQVRGAQRGMADLARVERLGVKLFLSGNYQQSATELERAVGAGVKSPRIYLFLASSRAAQALLAPQGERPALVAEARRHYALAKPDAPALTADQRFISPSILQLLAGS